MTKELKFKMTKPLKCPQCGKPMKKTVEIYNLRYKIKLSASETEFFKDKVYTCPCMKGLGIVRLEEC